MKSYVDEVDVCDIPIGEDDTRGPLYGFCIGNGCTGEKLANWASAVKRQPSLCRDDS